MKLRLLTWLDVRRIIYQKTKFGKELPEGIVRISCFSDALEIGIEKESDIENAQKNLKQWFTGWYKLEESVIYFDVGNATLPVEFITGEKSPEFELNIHPFWEEIAYFNLEDNQQQLVKIPEPFIDKSNIVAFYSFKGGVGRTLHLAAYFFALIEQAKQLNQPLKILVIDADLEAPGLTYWSIAEKQQLFVSFIDFLESYHYPADDLETSLAYLTKEIEKTAQSEGQITWYFLPAFIEDEELLDTPILPENLARNIDNSWNCSDAISRLGSHLKVDYILIDLRAGFSEISSPIIFDSRIQRFLVTTANKQSVEGTNLVLKKIGSIAPNSNKIDNQTYYDPSLIISLLTPELRALSDFDNIIDTFQLGYIQPDDNNPYSTRLEIKETFFAQELLYINNWQEARNKLHQTTVMESARQWANEQLQPPVNLPIDDKLTEVKKLKNICQKYEYAETGEGENLLITTALDNLAKTFQNSLPSVVSIGAKGAGKTFAYVQLSRFQCWENFLDYIKPTDKLNSKTYIFPLLQSVKLQDKALQLITSARNNLYSNIALENKQFKHTDLTDKILRNINKKDLQWSEPDWTDFWVGEIASAISLNPENITIDELNNYLKEKKLRIIFLFDGLEDIFTDISTNTNSKIALKSLIENLPNKLSEIRELNLGVIIFLRRDFLRYTITQNLKQFENLYSAYDLYWDEDSFINLVFWLCSEAKIIGAESNQLETLTKEEIKSKLELLWGQKLGTPKSKEAYSISWIFAALTDFNGNLQARDIVRFLYYTAELTIDKTKELQFEKWSSTRLLPPQAIRKALKPCSEKKVEEAKEEYPDFKKWVEEILPKYNSSELRIPFTPENLGLEPKTVKILEIMGVIYEDKEREEEERFYIPEIFREGLGFSFKVARPRILAIKRKLLKTRLR